MAYKKQFKNALNHHEVDICDIWRLWISVNIFYNCFSKKVCSPTRQTCKNVPYFANLFSKVCLMSYTHLWDFLLCTETQLVPKKLSFNFVVLILNIRCFKDVCIGISQKRLFSYIKKQRIFYQIIYLSKNKGFSTKSSNFKKRKKF